jgi:uncharacterized protein YndB with AHSA1/START domain
MGGIARPGAEVAVETRVYAPADVVYDMISDVTQMGRWSPETTECRWLDGADGPAVGTRFQGSNRAGWRRWSTTCTVTAAEPGRRFEFRVTYGRIPLSTWSYQLTREDGATVVRESWRERRPPWWRILTGRLMGVSNRAEHNRAGMEATLTALRAAAESRALSAE